MSSLEAKREQFRKYLERCGVIDALSKALIKLYEEANKPDDAVRFVRKFMCEACPDDEQFENLQADYEQAARTIQNLEEELERFKGNLKRTPSEIALLLDEGFTNLQDDTECTSLLRKFLTKEVFDELSLAKTPGGATLLDIVQSGLECHASKIGVYAADKESYDVFKPLLDPIIIDYHKIEDSDNPQLQKSVDWGDIGAIQDLDPDSKYIKSTRIRLHRNIEGFPFFSKLSEDQFKDIEERVKAVCEGLEGEHKGSYYSLRDLDHATQTQMVGKKILFKKGDPFLNAAGGFRFWPTGRGMFHNPADSFVVWVNQEDHIRIISMAKCGDLGDVYSRLVAGDKIFEENMQYQRHNKYGFVTSCPTNLGTTIRASVHIALPNLSRNMDELQELCNGLNLEIRGTTGENSEIEMGILDISNKKRVGLTEFETVKSMQDGILELIKREDDAEP